MPGYSGFHFIHQLLLSEVPKKEDARLVFRDLGSVLILSHCTASLNGKQGNPHLLVPLRVSRRFLSVSSRRGLQVALYRAFLPFDLQSPPHVPTRELHSLIGINGA